MKKVKNILIGILISTGILSLTACVNQKQKPIQKENTDIKKSSSNVKSEVENEVKYTIKDYYPFRSNTRMKYEGKGNEYAANDVYVDYISGNRMQTRESNGGTIVGKVMENKNGELRVLISKGEFYYRDNLIKLMDEDKYEISTPQEDIILKEPIKVGTKWNNYQGKERKITDVNVDVNTPLGKYKSIEVTTKGENFITKDYFALQIGHIKSIYESKDMKVITSLGKIEYDKGVVQTIKFYYPKHYEKLNTEALVYKKNRIEFKTNNKLEDVLEKYFKEVPDKESMQIISDNTKINYVYLNDEEKKVYIDFSKEFVSEMNAGTTKETLVLQAVTNTLGDYYNVDKVYISVDGRPYESGHILMGKDEYFKVDLKKCNEI